jgi:hypothetical protein
VRQAAIPPGSGAERDHNSLARQATSKRVANRSNLMRALCRIQDPSDWPQRIVSPFRVGRQQTPRSRRCIAAPIGESAAWQCGPGASHLAPPRAGLAYPQPARIWCPPAGDMGVGSAHAGSPRACRPIQGICKLSESKEKRPAFAHDDPQAIFRPPGSGAALA